MTDPTETQKAPLCTDPECIDAPHFQDDPRCVSWSVSMLKPEDLIRYIPNGKVHIVERRKDDDSGWWLLDENRQAAGGIADSVWYSTQQWEVWEYMPLSAEPASVSEIGTDYDGGDPGEQAQLLHDLNEQRVAALESDNGQPGSLENAFDALRFMTMLEHICAKLEITAETMLDFEGRRGAKLDDIEEKLAEMKQARAAADRQQRLAGGPVGRRAGVAQRPGRGGVVGPG